MNYFKKEERECMSKNRGGKEKKRYKTNKQSRRIKNGKCTRDKSKMWKYMKWGTH